MADFVAGSEAAAAHLGGLDRAVEWLVRAGHRPDILLEEQEVPEFRQRFRGARAVSGLEGAPILIYEADQIAGQVYLFDPMFPVSQTWQPAPIRAPQPRCPRPIHNIIDR